MVKHGNNMVKLPFSPCFHGGHQQFFSIGASRPQWGTDHHGPKRTAVLGETRGFSGEAAVVCQGLGLMSLFGDWFHITKPNICWT